MAAADGDATAQLALFVARPECADLVMDFLATVGGDLGEFAIADVARVRPSQLAVALQRFLQDTVQLPEFADSEIAAAVWATDVDWPRIADVALQSWEAAIRTRAERDPDELARGQEIVRRLEEVRVRQTAVDAEKSQTRRQFMKSVHAAVGTVDNSLDWKVSTAGLSLRSDNGNWAVIDFAGFETGAQWAPAVSIRFDASAQSGYVMKQMHGGDPQRRPRHASNQACIVGAYPIFFQREPTVELPLPFDPSRTWPEHNEQRSVLTPQTARGWLADALSWIMPRLTALMPDDQMLEWYLEQLTAADNPASRTVREAALLAHLLHRHPEQAMLLDLDSQACAAAREQFPNLTYRDRSANPSDWSPERFALYVQDL